MHVAGTSYTNVSRNVLSNEHLGNVLGRYKRLGLGISDGLGKQTGVMRARTYVIES